MQPCRRIGSVILPAGIFLAIFGDRQRAIVRTGSFVEQFARMNM
jgi:hypothetical protein